jgi:hypothetical protein
MARKTPAKPTPPAEPVPPRCEVCKGTGIVAVPVRVGRSRRLVGSQDGMCLACFGATT